MIRSTGMPKKAQGLSDQIDRGALPAHIAIIMDGNGRWARKRGLPRVAGHRAGINAVREVIEGSAELGIPVLTLYAFSVENWKRPQAEVSTLMQLLEAIPEQGIGKHPQEQYPVPHDRPDGSA